MSARKITQVRSGIGQSDAISARFVRSVSERSGGAPSTAILRAAGAAAGRSAISSPSRRIVSNVSDELNLSNLRPAQARRGRKRIGRGLGWGKVVTRVAG